MVLKQEALLKIYHSEKNYKNRAMHVVRVYHKGRQRDTLLQFELHALPRGKAGLQQLASPVLTYLN